MFRSIFQPSDLLTALDTVDKANYALIIVDSAHLAQAHHQHTHGMQTTAHEAAHSMAPCTTPAEVTADEQRRLVEHQPMPLATASTAPVVQSGSTACILFANTAAHSWLEQACADKALTPTATGAPIADAAPSTTVVGQHLRLPATLGQASLADADSRQGQHITAHNVEWQPCSDVTLVVDSLLACPVIAPNGGSIKLCCLECLRHLKGIFG